MKFRFTPQHRKLTVLAGLIALAVVGYATASRETPLPASPQAATEPGGERSVRFPPGAPQLSFLRIEVAAAMPVPLAEALSSRIAYDDEVTAKIYAPVAGRVIQIGRASCRERVLD